PRCGAPVAATRLRPYRQHRLDRRQGGQPKRLCLFGGESRGDRPHQIARQGAGGNRHSGQLRKPCRGPHRHLRADDRGADRIHAVEDPDGPLRPGRGNRRAGRLARLRGVLVLYRRRVRYFRRPRHLLSRRAGTFCSAIPNNNGTLPFSRSTSGPCHRCKTVTRNPGRIASLLSLAGLVLGTGAAFAQNEATAPVPPPLPPPAAGPMSPVQKQAPAASAAPSIAMPTGTPAAKPDMNNQTAAPKPTNKPADGKEAAPADKPAAENAAK